MMDYLNPVFDSESTEFISVIDELPFWSAPFGIKLLDKIHYRKHITVIDIGSGPGFPLLEVAMRLGNSCKLYGIDPWEKAVERIRLKITTYGIKNVEIITGTAENIPLPDNSVDLIISNNGINNVNNIHQTLGECKRIAKAGAQFVFTFNTDKTMTEFYSTLEHVLLKKNLNDVVEKMKLHIYEKRKPVEEIVYLLMENNFSINEVSQDEFRYTFVDGTTMFNHFLIQLAFIESWKKILPDEVQRTVFREIEERLNARADDFSSLKLTIPFVLMDAVRI